MSANRSPRLPQRQEGRDLADALGDGSFSRNCRFWLSVALWFPGRSRASCPGRPRLGRRGAGGRGSTHDGLWSCVPFRRAFHPRGRSGRRARRSAIRTGDRSDDRGSFSKTLCMRCSLTPPWPAATRQQQARQPRRPCGKPFPRVKCLLWAPAHWPRLRFARGDLVTARRWADNVVAVVPGWYQMLARTVRAFVAIAEGEPEQAERDAHEALVVAARTQAYTRVADTFECLARLATGDSNHQHAVRLLGVAKAARQRIGDFRLPMYPGYDTMVAAAHGRRWGRVILMPRWLTVLLCRSRRRSHMRSAAVASANSLPVGGDR